MNATHVSNSAALAGAERHYRRLNGWFWIFIALIPLGVILPCGVSILAYRIWGDRVSAPIALSALLWPIIGVAGALLLRGARVRAGRSLGVARLAHSSGWMFTDKPAPEKYAFLRSVSFMENPHFQSARNLLESGSARLAWIALDYEYTYSWGSVSEVGEQTIVVYPKGFEHLPQFAIVPIGIMGRIENFFLGKGDAIECGSNPQFDRRFTVVGADARAIRRCVSPALIDLFVSDPSLTLMAESGRLLIFRRLTYVSASDYPAFLKQALTAAKLLDPTTINAR